MKPRDHRPLLIVSTHAGGSAASYRRLVTALQDFDVKVLDRPGTGLRRREPFIDKWPALVAHTADDVERLAGQRPYVLFGHSMGAILAYETAQKLQHSPSLLGLVVSGASAPRVFHKAHTQMPDDDQLWDMVTASGLLPSSSVSDLAKQFVLPSLRRDLVLCLAYQPIGDLPLRKATALLYAGDDQIVPRHSAMQWEKAVDPLVHRSEVSGGHFFVMKSPEAIADAITAVLAAAGAPLKPAVPTTAGNAL